MKSGADPPAGFPILLTDQEDFVLDRRKFLGATTVTAAVALASCSQGADTASTAADLTKPSVSSARR